jgi:hypothetical protein
MAANKENNNCKHVTKNGESSTVFLICERNKRCFYVGRMQIQIL